MLVASHFSLRQMKQSGSHRMDAAYDALTPFGFSKGVIGKTIKDLLKVYGDDQWAFLEADCYKVVLDALLEEQEDEGDKLEGEGQIKGAVDDSQAIEICDQAIEAGQTSSARKIITAEAAQSSRGEFTLTSSDVDGLGSDLTPVSRIAGPSIIHQPMLHAVAGDVNRRSLQQCHEVSRRKRAPCYGWISESESESEDHLDHSVSKSQRLVHVHDG